MRLVELHLDEALILSQPVNEMAGIPTANSGLPYFLWIGKIGGQHGPRIKVSNKKGKFAEDDCFVISVGKPPIVMTPTSMHLKQNELDDILDWATLNYTTLMGLYQMYETGDGDVVHLLSSLKKI